MDALEVFNLLNFFIFSFLMSRFDLREKRLPNLLMYPAILIALVISLIRGLLAESTTGILMYLVQVFLITSFFLAISLISSRMFGMGDVKAILFLGLSLSPFDVRVFIGSIALSFFSASIFIIFARLVLSQRFKEFPFGPFLFAPGSLLLLVTWF